MNTGYIQKNTGFVLFYAVLIVSLVLSVAIATANITFKQGRLTSGAVDSQIAFYAADTGMECALYWDVQKNVFNGVADNPRLTCNSGESVTASLVAPLKWRFSLTSAGLHCAIVEIDKSDEKTEILSRGYSTCDTTNVRRIERGMRATY